MGEQFMGTLLPEKAFVRLVAVKDIEGPRWTFPKGKRLCGRRHKDGSWDVWPSGQENAYLVGVPGRLVRRAVRKKQNAGGEGRA